MSVWTLDELFSRPRVVAVVGLSDRLDRPSHGVARYLLQHGWTVVPVNPMLQTWMGLPCWPDLDAVPDAVEVVDVFRRTEEVAPVAEAALRIGAKCLWQQIGVVDRASDQRAREAGLLSVMDRCLKIEHALWLMGRSQG